MRDILDKLTRKKRDGDNPDQSKEVVDKGSPGEASEARSEGTVSTDKRSVGIEPDKLTAEDNSRNDAQFTDSALSDLEKGVEVTQKKNASIEETAVAEAPMTIVADKDVATHRRVAPFLKVGQSCHLGNVRERNEDSIFVLNTFSGGEDPYVPFGLYIVADGMGGHYAGHEASKSTSAIMAREVTENILLPLLKNEAGAVTTRRQPIGEVMLGAIQAANNHIYNPDPEKQGGTTATAALIIGRRLYIAHVGDSRAYLLTNDRLKQVTTDHSYVGRLMEAGQLTEEEAAIHPQRNMVYRAVGAGGKLEVETFTQTLPEQGKIVLCSDGLWGLVPDTVIENKLRGNGSIQGDADFLVDYALKMGGYDNISIIIIDFSF